VARVAGVHAELRGPWQSWVVGRRTVRRWRLRMRWVRIWRGTGCPRVWIRTCWVGRWRR